jgi:predicted transcriptional regulator
MSGGRDNRVWTYLTDDEKAQLSEWAADSGKSESQLLREAIMEYLDNDRTARIEEQVGELADQVEEMHTLLADNTHTHTDTPDQSGPDTEASPTVQRAREIAERVHENNAEAVSEPDLDRAVKDIAGGDTRTLRKYRTELVERGHLYPHPSDTSPVYYLDRDQWLTIVRKHISSEINPDRLLKDILRGTPVSYQEVVGAEIPREVVDQ